MECCSVIRKDEIMQFTDDMDVSVDYLAHWSDPEGEGQI